MSRLCGLAWGMLTMNSYGVMATIMFDVSLLSLQGGIYNQHSSRISAEHMYILSYAYCRTSDSVDHSYNSRKVFGWWNYLLNTIMSVRTIIAIK